MWIAVNNNSLSLFFSILLPHGQHCSTQFYLVCDWSIILYQYFTSGSDNHSAEDMGVASVDYVLKVFLGLCVCFPRKCMTNVRSNEVPTGEEE